MHRRIRITTALVFAVATLGSAGTAAAKPPTADDATDYTRIFARVAQLEQRGVSRTTIDRMLEREFGWVRESEDPAVEPMALPSASDVTIFKPTIYRNLPAQRYEVTAKWDWKDCGSEYCWSANYPHDTGTIGGPDGFAINISRPVTNLATNFVTYTETNSGRIFTNPETFETDGVGFREQDNKVTDTTGYNWDHGTLVFAFRLAGACVPGQQFKISSKMGHTWNDAGLSDISIGLTNIGMTFSGSNEYWQLTNPSPLWWTPC